MNHLQAASRTFFQRSLGIRSALSLFLSFTLFLPPCLEAFSAATPVTASASPDKKPKQDPALRGLPISDLSVDEAILHALNRLAHGPRPGDLERVKQMGLAKWIDQQLNPGSIDDKSVDARVSNLPTLRMSSTQLIHEYPQPKQAAKQAGQTPQEFRQQTAQAKSAAAAPESARGPQTNAGKPSPLKQDAANRTT